MLLYLFEFEITSTNVEDNLYETLYKAFLLLAHDSPKVRAALLENASLCEMGLDDYIAKILMRDKDPIVQDAVNKYYIKHGDDIYEDTD